MLPSSSQKKSSQREDFDLGLCAFHHLKNNPPKRRIPKRWDKNPVQEILLIEGYLHVSTFYSALPSLFMPKLSILLSTAQHILHETGTQFLIALQPHKPCDQYPPG